MRHGDCKNASYSVRHKTDTFANGHVELLKVQIPPDSILAGKTLMEMPGLVKSKILVCAVERGEQGIYIPSGSFRLEAGDRISFVASIRDAQAFFHQIKLAVSRVRTVMIVGGGHIAYYLAKQLTDLGMGVKIIEATMSAACSCRRCFPRRKFCTATARTRAFCASAALPRPMRLQRSRALMKKMF